MNSEQVCRICLSDDDNNDIISPCDCKGTQKYVHRNCLDVWRTVKPKFLTSCSICRFEFYIEDRRSYLNFKRYLYFIPFFLLVLVLVLMTPFSYYLLLFFTVCGCIRLSQTYGTSFIIVSHFILQLHASILYFNYNISISEKVVN